jgi:hypothetical protein
LSGLVAAVEAADLGRRVLILDQENDQNLGGQAFWSLGGLFFVDSPEQRRLGIHDSLDVARRDWMSAAAFDRPEDEWPRKWAEAYLEFAAGEKRAWLHQMGMRWFPAVGWAERLRNTVPRFHVTWGTGPGVLEPFVRRLREQEKAGRIELRFRHRVRELITSNGTVIGVRGHTLQADDAARGVCSSRVVIGDFEIAAGAVIVTSGGIGGNHDLVRRHWPVARLGSPPDFMLSGVPAHVDGQMQLAAQRAGARMINVDRMWHYTEGIRNWNPVWPSHGIRILPGPSSAWLAPDGERLPFPHVPGGDTLATLQHIGQAGHPYTWFVLNRAIIRKEFALSGSEQNPDLTSKSWRKVLRRVGRRVQPPVQAFMDRGPDFVVRDTLRELVDAMNDIGTMAVDFHRVDRSLREFDDGDPQMKLARNARTFLSERLIRVIKPAPILEPKNGPLVAVRLNILTRKSLGGLHTDLHARVLDEAGDAIPGLYGAGEVTGFGGGGLHGYRALEGTFLGGCLFSGRIAGRAAAARMSS